MSDNVNHPAHYTQGGVECIEALKACLGDAGFVGFLRGCAIKYLWRVLDKEKPAEDAKKAAWYVQKLIEELESEQKMFGNS